MTDEKKIPKSDEFGTTRFTLYSDYRASATFEHEEGSDAIFITFKDKEGRAISKALLNINNPNNEALVEAFEAYMRETEQEQKEI